MSDLLDIMEKLQDAQETNTEEYFKLLQEMEYADILEERIHKIQNVIQIYGEENFYISFSGGKDSTVMSFLFDLALPDNKIPRVYADTGIELNIIKDFVKELQKTDERIQIIRPSKNIKAMLEEDGYPFKSKGHSAYVDRYQRSGMTKSVNAYLGLDASKNWSNQKSCPKILKYQFTSDFKLKVSEKCCQRMKKDPVHKWEKENGKKYGIVGVRRAEEGNRTTAKCLAFENGKLERFQPLAPLTNEWVDWFIKEYKIKICDVYNAPYNFKRTGCKGCPFAVELQHELDILEEYFPTERRQCEIIWKPVYDEYRRLGYRLKGASKQIEGQMTLFDLEGFE